MSLRKWAVDRGHVFGDDRFLRNWTKQGKRGGAEHHVYYDPGSGRWFKRLYRGVNSSTLGEYLVRMRLHAVLFPEKGQLETLCLACHGHTHVTHSDDPTVGTCWDADRLDLTRLGIAPDPRFLNTDKARQLARIGDFGELVGWDFPAGS